jgi:hypothetical protein
MTPEQFVWLIALLAVEAAVLIGGIVLVGQITK